MRCMCAHLTRGAAWQQRCGCSRRCTSCIAIPLLAASSNPKLAPKKSKGKTVVAKPKAKTEYSSSSVEKETAVLAETPIDKFLATAHKRWQSAAEAESEVRTHALDDLRFRTGEQWPEDIKITRSKDNRPCLEMDRIEQFVRAVCNEERQQRPSIQVNPVGSGADRDTAEIEQGLIRHIEVQSQADGPRDHAFETMVTTGLGYYRIIVEEDELTGEQEIYVRWIKNRFCVYRDPNTTKQDYSDARWYFIIEDLDREDYEAQYPNSKLASLEDWSSIGDSGPGWVSKDSIRVAEYYYVEGTGKNRKVYWSKINAVECLEGGPDDPIDCLTKWIPIIAVVGIDLQVENKIYQAGLVRKLKDPQRQYNYMNSAATEAIALAPKAPWVMVEGQNEGHEEMWRTANTRNWSTLYYKSVDVAGKPAPPPARNTVEPPIQAMMEMVRQANSDLQGAAGILNPSEGGALPADHSGKAILARQRQSETNNLNWTDNLARSMWFEGRILLDLIPKVYTESKVRRIVNPDGTVKNVGIVNSPDEDPKIPEELQDVGEIYNIGVGSYDVTISVGPSYQSKRQEAVASQLAFIQSFPQAAPLIGDLIAANMDWPGAKEIQKRLHAMLPPQLQENDGSPESQLESAQAQLQQQGALLQQQHGLISQLQQEREGKVLEMQTKKEIEQLRIQADLQGKTLQYQTQLAVAQINASKDANQSFADNELEVLGMAHDAAHEQAMAQMQHGQAMELSQQQADQAQQAAAQQAAQQQPDQPTA